jgi:radical SAM protein with 4Fe4S-binding SPASM domain
MKVQTTQTNSPDQLPAPFIWQVELTNRCVKNCLGCPRQFMTRAVGDMPFETFQACVDSVQDIQADHRPMGLHHFGEALLHPGLGRFIAYAAGKNVPTWLSVNPDLMTFKMAREMIAAGLSRVTFSLDGLDDEVLGTIRGSEASFQAAYQGILDFIRARDMERAECQIRVQMIAYQHNQHQWEAFLDLWQGKEVFAYIKDFDSWTHPELAELGVKSMHNTCTFPFHSVVVLRDGRIVPCCHDYDGELVMGSIHDGLEQVWRGEKYRRFRKAFSDGLFLEEHLCWRCGWWGVQ